GKDKTKVYAVRAILAVRSRVFLEMLYGFSTGFGLSSSGPGDSSSRVLSPSGAKSSGNFLQASPSVPDIHDAPRNKSAPSSPMVIRAFSRLGNWTGWSSRTSSKDPLIPDIGGLKRWQSECNCKEKEKERNTVIAGTTVTLSVCADAHKVDRAKLCQHEVRSLTTVSNRHQHLVDFLRALDYLHHHSPPPSGLTVPALRSSVLCYNFIQLFDGLLKLRASSRALAVILQPLKTRDNYSEMVTNGSTTRRNIFLKSKLIIMGVYFFVQNDSRLQTKLRRTDITDIIYRLPIKLFRFRFRHCQILNVADLCSRNKCFGCFSLQVVLPTRTISHEQILETLLYQADTGMFRVRQSYLEAVNKKGERYLLSPALTKYRR
ncbi:unnamed protein product, partial [Ixodes hexagonus]